MIRASTAEGAGKRVEAVPPAYTSQDCRGCGERVQKSLSVSACGPRSARPVASSSTAMRPRPDTVKGPGRPFGESPRWLGRRTENPPPCRACGVSAVDDGLPGRLTGNHSGADSFGAQIRVCQSIAGRFESLQHRTRPRLHSGDIAVQVTGDDVYYGHRPLNGMYVCAIGGRHPRNFPGAPA
jgi:hypothetical protein